MQSRSIFVALLAGCIPMLSTAADTAGKASFFQHVQSSSAATGAAGNRPGLAGGGGYRTAVTNGVVTVPLVVVAGTPYEMGWHLGHLLKPEITQFLPRALEGMKTAMHLTDPQLNEVWASTAAYTDDRFEQELLGVADGAGLPRRIVQQVHCIPLLMPYSCSSVAAWGKATEDGHLYQTRNLDWNMEVKAHEFPVLVVYLPRRGTPHLLPTFAGVAGANCGMNLAGLALSEMGDSPAKEMPYRLDAPHFTTLFRTLLYDATDLSTALDLFRKAPQTKRYHYVFGDGRREKRAVKIRAHSLESSAARLQIWRDNDPTDELAPAVLPDLVYQDEGRGAFPIIQKDYGKLNAARMIALANQIPIRGGNVMNVVFDATAFRVWVSYAHGDQEAYQRPYVAVDLKALDGDGDGVPDLEERAEDRNGNGVPDLLEP